MKPSARIKAAVVVAAALGAVACASGAHPITTSDVLGGGPAIETTLLVKRGCPVSAGGLHFVLPVGEYRPTQVDSHGVFFSAPDGIVERRGNEEKTIPGGIHVPDVQGRYYSFLSMWVSFWEGDVSKLPLPNECWRSHGFEVSLTRNGVEVVP